MWLSSAVPSGLEAIDPTLTIVSCPVFAAFVTVTNYARHEHLTMATPDRPSASPNDDAGRWVLENCFTRPFAFGAHGRPSLALRSICRRPRRG